MGAGTLHASPGSAKAGNELTVTPLFNTESGLVATQHAYQTLAYQVTGQALAGDVSVSVSGTRSEDVTLLNATLSSQKIQSAEGDTLRLAIKTHVTEAGNVTLEFSGGGTGTQVLEWTVYPTTTVTPAQLRESGDEYTDYHLEDMTITYAEYSPSGASYYAEANGEGIQIKDEWGLLAMLGRQFEAGEKIEDLVGYYTPGGMTSGYFIPAYDPGAAVEGTPVEPATVTLAELQAGKSTYENRLVKVEKVVFFNKAGEGETFAETAKSYSIRQTEDQTQFKGRTLNASFSGMDIPDTATIVGISTSPAGTVVGMRSPDDITAYGGGGTEPGPEPEPEPEPEPGFELGENILENPGFEEWGVASMFNPSGDLVAWSAPMGAFSQESTEKIEGEYALKIEKPGMLPNLSQSITLSSHNFIPGERYRLAINYYVVEGDAEGNDITLASYWSSQREDPMAHEEEILNNGTWFTSVGKWEKKEFTTTVPEEATSFTFRLKIGKSSTVLFDDFSMRPMLDTTEPARIIVEPASLEPFAAIPGAVDSSQSIKVMGSRLQEDITVAVTGPDAALFGVSADRIAPDAANFSLKLYYKPVEEGTHDAVLVLANPDADTVEIALQGQCSSSFTPAIVINDDNLVPFSATLGQESQQEIRVSGRNLEDYVSVSMQGDGKSHFRISTTMLPVSFEDLPFTITYAPKSEGSHSMEVVFTSGQLEERLQVSGVCGAADTNWIETFETLPVDSELGDFYASGVRGEYRLVGAVAGNDPETDVFEGTRSVRLVDDGAYVEMDFDVLDSVSTLTFMAAAGKTASGPVKYGIYVSRDFGLTWSLAGDTLTTLAAGEKSNPLVVVEQNAPLRFRISKFDGGSGNTLNIDDLSLKTHPASLPGIDALLALDDSNPLDSLNETFSGMRHNKPMAVEGWRNVLVSGLRPWWTYQHKDLESGDILDYSAKATAFMSNVDNPGDFEMWMVTPALNGKDPKSKMFTFRVMGDLMPEKDSINTLELYYIEKDGEGYFKQVIEVDMPQGKDYNGEWREFHVDLTNSEVADVFFMAFRYAAPGGRSNSTVYYIDDVTYGRTDLPSIRCEQAEITFEAEQYAVASSSMISVEGKNLTEPIQIGFTGNNPSNFQASPSVLEPQGGSFVINFMSMNAGIHSALLRLSSRGAADLYVPVTVTVAPAEPRILVAVQDLELTVEEGFEEAVSEPVTVNGLLLSDSIYLALEGPDADLFSLSREIMPGNGLDQTFTVAFRPGTATEASAAIRLSSEGAEDVLISLTGVNLNVSNQGNEAFDLRVWRRHAVFFVEAPQMQQIRVISASGSVVLVKDLSGAGHAEIDLGSYAPGLYILQVVSTQGAEQVKIVR